MSGSSNKKISPNKKFYAKSNGALLNVYSTEDDVQIHSLPLNQYELLKPDIFRWSRDSQAIGMLIGRSLPFDAGGWTSHRNNYWVGIWYPFLQSFFTVHFPGQTELQVGEDLVNSIEVLADKGMVICSVNGKEFKSVEMPKEPMLLNWQKEKQVLESVAPKQSDPNQKEWTWNHNQYGYEGVHLYGGEVLWYDHRHNPHDGGAAREQSF